MNKTQRGKAQGDFRGRQWYGERRKELHKRVRQEVRAGLRKYCK